MGAYVYADDIASRQQIFDELVSSVREPDTLPDPLIIAAQHLVLRLDQIAGDGDLWTRLRQATAGIETQQLDALQLINWSPLLETVGYQPPPQTSFVAGQARRLLERDRTRGGKADWVRLRDHITWLGARIRFHLEHPPGTTAAEEQPDAGRAWHEQLEARVDLAWEVVTRVDLKRALLRALPAGVEAGLEIVLLSEPVITIAKLVAEVGIITYEELVEARALLEKGRGLPLTVITTSSAISSAHRQRAGDQAQHLVAVVRQELFRGVAHPGSSFNPAAALDALRLVDDWSSAASAELAARWRLIAAQPDPAALLQALGGACLELEAALADLRTSLEEVRADRALATTAVSSSSRVRAAQTRLAALLRTFDPAQT